ncbi:MAG: hypothetical protein ACRD1A_12145 [Terriglobales bacterium]
MLAGCAVLLAAAAPAPRWRLRASALVATPQVTLADLLLPSPSSPAAAPALAAAVLGPAPQPGSPLLWTRAQLAAHLRAAGADPARFAIPAEVQVIRRAAPIARAQVAAALARYLRRPIAPASLQFNPPLTTAPGDPGIAVVSTRPDRLRGALVAICRARLDPALLPFTVLLPLADAPAPAVASAAAQPTLGPTQPGLGLARAPAHTAPIGSGDGEAALPPAPILVLPGRPATLTIRTTGFALTSRVMPLQAGHAGQRIRAQSLVTHALLSVIVTGPNAVASDSEPPYVPR